MSILDQITNNPQATAGTYALVLLLWNARLGNDMTTIHGFTSLETCEQAGKEWSQRAAGVMSTPYTYCVGVR